MKPIYILCLTVLFIAVFAEEKCHKKQFKRPLKIKKQRVLSRHPKSARNKTRQSRSITDEIEEQVGLWMDGIVPFFHDSGFELLFILDIIHAMKAIESKTCVSFCRVPIQSEQAGGDRVRIINGTDWSDNGAFENESTNVFFNDEMFQRDLVHELMRALGFEEEHNRMDRDQYLHIFHEHIYDKGAVETVDWAANKLTAYDLDSIMHLGDTTLSKEYPDLSYWVKTPHPRKPGASYVLSTSDIERVNKMYECEDGEVSSEPTRETGEGALADVCPPKVGGNACDCCVKFKDACTEMKLTQCIGLCNACC